MVETQVTKLLGIKYPILQGGMAWIANHSLASAVSNAGGLGIVAAGGHETKVVREEIRKTKELTDKPFGVNIMLLSPYAEEIAHMVAEEKVAVVTTGAGNPGKYIPMWKENNIKVIPVVPSSALAVRMERAGADAVICEGCEAGGHIGELTTMALVPQVVDAVKIPVIAAGGIADARGILAAFVLGASGVQMGTRFLVAEECTVHENYKDLIISAKDTDTVVTGRSTGHPVRVIRNKLTRKVLELEKERGKEEEIERLCTGSLKNAAILGDVEFGSVMAGQIAGLVNRRQSAKEILDELVSDFIKLRNSLGGSL
ncbi:MAG: enoyl-[acyl-carrier-protein] reductase FabK [Clostridiaceae bacterium]|nr:enoyl-[acyl-carrier-protein] reductase FabK [Clostridiaceae bacterium]